MSRNIPDSKHKKKYLNNEHKTNKFYDVPHDEQLDFIKSRRFGKTKIKTHPNGKITVAEDK